jgi:hypothetical protein
MLAPKNATSVHNRVRPSTRRQATRAQGWGVHP